MERRVLVSGRPDQATQVAEALRERGCQITEVHDLAEMTSVCAAAGRHTFDAYVQLPSTFRVSGESAIQRVHRFYADGVLARFTALDAAVPALAADARIIFVMGQLPAEAATSADKDARQALTRVLAQAATADRPDADFVVRFLAAGTVPRDVAYAALGGDLERRQLMERLSELSYADWRVELLGLATMET